MIIAILEYISKEWKYVIFAGIILTLAIVFSTIIRKLISRFVKKRSLFLKVDPTRFNFIKNALSFIIYLTAIIVIFYTIPELRSLGTTLFAGAGIFAAILAFASQQAFSNIISGVFIVIFKPFRVGDWIEIGVDHMGIVQDINLRHTVIRNFKNKRIIIPNSVISSETIVNNHVDDERSRQHVNFGISYDSDIDLAFKIMTEEAEKHPLFLDARTKEEKKKKVPAVICRVVGFGDSSVNLRAYVWTDSPESGWDLFCDLNKSIKERFDKEGVEIPFPYRTLVFKDQKGKKEFKDKME